MLKRYIHDKSGLILLVLVRHPDHGNVPVSVLS